MERDTEQQNTQQRVAKQQPRPAGRVVGAAAHGAEDADVRAREVEQQMTDESGSHSSSV